MSGVGPNNAMLDALFTEIVAAILVETGRQGLVQLFTGPPASRAIKKTVADFPNIPTVEDSLTRWCKTDDFISRVETLHAGYDEQGYDQLVNSFIDQGGFYDGINKTHVSARRVLESFFKQLEEELYKTELGPIIEARRAKNRHRATQVGLNELSQQIQQLPSGVEAVVNKALSQYIPQFNPENNPAVQEKIYFANIDLAVDLLKEGKPRSARKRLEELRTKLASENPSVDLRFRLVANLGSCALQLDDYETAEKEYEEALVFKPEHRLVLSYAALTATLTNDTDRAVKYAERSRPAGEHDPQITSSYLRVLHHANRDDEIESLLRDEEWIESDGNCAFALGLIRLSQQKFAEAEAYFRISFKNDSENPHVLRLLAQTIILPIDQILHTDPPVELSKETLARVGEAESYLTRAVEIFEKHENASGLYESLLQRAYVRGLQGQYYAALADCDRLLSNHPNDGRALFQKGHTLLFAGKADEALECYSRINDEDDRQASLRSIALAYDRANKPKKVIEVLASSWRPAERSRQQATILDLLLNAYEKTGNTERVKALISEVERERANDSDALAVLARHHMRFGEKEKALARYEKALEHAASDNQRARINDELAEYYLEVREWAAAAELLKDSADSTKNNPRTRMYLTSLYNSGARRAALDVARKVRGGREAIPFVSEIEARVLLAAGDLEESLRLFSELAKFQPTKTTYRLWMVDIQRRLKDNEGARKTLEAITFGEVKNDSTALIQVAMFRQQLELGGDLPFAYRARQLSFNDPDVHHAYVQLFMDHTRRERGDLDVNGVAVDFAVHLEDAKGEKKTYLIVEQDEYDINQGEISPTDPRALEMLGKYTGDTLVFNRGRVDEVEHKIVDIQSKYVYAFQQTIKKHTEWFGGSDGMIVMDVADKDFSKFFRMIDQQQARQRETAELYRERRLPLAMVASLKGANLFETWAGLVNSNDLPLHMTTGDVAEFNRSLEAVRMNNAIVVEITALFTLNMLDLLDELPKIFRRIIVAQAVLDKLETWIVEAERRSPYMTIREEGGQYFREEITEEMIARSKDFLNKIRSFVETNAELRPAVKALDTPAEQLKMYEEALGVSAASVFVASELKLPLYVDDVGLSQLASGPEWEVQGTSTLAILWKMKSRGLMSAYDHCLALKRLILANYIVVSVNALQLLWICQSEGKKATLAMKHILRRSMQGPEWEEASALQVAAEFSYRMWKEVREIDDRFQLLELITEALVTGREPERIKTLFKSALSKSFVHLPNALPLIYERLDSR
jgi:tetratricopeptide (TPR) repeat protein